MFQVQWVAESGEVAEYDQINTPSPLSSPLPHLSIVVGDATGFKLKPLFTASKPLLSDWGNFNHTKRNATNHRLKRGKRGGKAPGGNDFLGGGHQK